MTTIRRTRRPARKPGSTAAGGWGSQHQRMREQWRPIVEAGQAYCHNPVCLEAQEGKGRRIRPGQPWDLGHTRDRRAYRGPEHARCNRAEGWRMVKGKWKGKRPPRMRRVTQPARMATSRQW